MKNAVDNAIDLCSSVINLRDSIEEARLRAEEAVDEKQKKMHTAKALQHLKRYFELIVFQAYLHSTEPDTLQSFETENVETFVKNRPGKCQISLLCWCVEELDRSHQNLSEGVVG